MERICIVGAGAIGGFIGTRLAARTATRVSALARGDTLAALRAHGWRLRTADGAIEHGPVALASDAPAALGPQDLVVIAVKAPALGALAPTLAPLLGPQTIVLPAMNGVPWWFCAGIDGVDGEPLPSVDPGGRIAASLDVSRVLGCVVHASTSTAEPGVVQHRMGNGLIVGEARRGAGITPRVESVAALLGEAGFDVRASADIRQDVWYKLWGNMTMNPVSALTSATADAVQADPLVRALCSQAMMEAREVGARLGCPIDELPEARHAITARLGALKTSMLQDVEAGRPLELDALVGAVHELGLRTGVATPMVDALLGLTRLFGRQRGLYPREAD